MKDYSKIKNVDELIDLEYGKIGTDSRKEFEERTKIFIDKEMHKVAKLEAIHTQEQLAEIPLKSADITPLVKSLSGVIKLDRDFDFKKEYSNYLVEKYK